MGRSSLPSLNPDETRVMRQALAGMLWSKQLFFFDVGKWLKQHGILPYKANQRSMPQRSLGSHEKRGHYLHAG
jgi:hypothetical protein